MGNVKMSFKDAPTGARFKLPEVEGVWVKLNSFPKGPHYDGTGLICSWNGNIPKVHQSYCCFVDVENGIDFNTEIELI